MNNSPYFSYKMAIRSEQSRLFVALTLTSIFALEYVLVAISYNVRQANYELIANASFAGFLIIFFSSNLSSFNLVKGYWRDIYFSSREKRGYGPQSPYSGLVSWYFVNSIRAHNYVGLEINIANDPDNYFLEETLYGNFEGKIIDRIILYEQEEPDPHWFIVKLVRPIPFTTDNPYYVLVKLRNQNSSLLYEDAVQVFFKAIPDIRNLKTSKPDKNLFPFYGWAMISFVPTSHNK